MTKDDFYKAFARLHWGRVNNYFEEAVPFDDFMDDFIYVNAFDASNKVFCQRSKAACQKINAFLDCDFYSAKMFDAFYDREGLAIGFFISIKPEYFESLCFELYMRLNKDLSAIGDEWQDFKVPEHKVWEILAIELEAESTFGSLKRIPVVTSA